MSLLEQSQRRTAQVRAASVAVLLLASAWAFWPLRTPVSESPAVREFPSPRARDVDITAQSFQVALWNATPDEPLALKVERVPPPPPPPVPLPQLRVQLIGIHTSAGGAGNSIRCATLYDPDTDRLLQVVAGDIVSGREVAVVEEAAIVLRAASGVHRLALREGSTP